MVGTVGIVGGYEPEQVRKRIRDRISQGRDPDPNDLYKLKEHASIGGGSNSVGGRARALLEELEERR
jgi:hypothetical protein